jgi:hypothetical protein
MATLKIGDELYTKPALNAIGGARWEYKVQAILAADLSLTTQFIAMAVLPAGHRLMDAFVESADLDTGGPSVTLNVGILNTYYGEPAASASKPAAYNSGGATDTGVTPALVSGQNILTSSTVCGTGGRVGISGSTLTPSKDIGVDKTKDRIIAIQFPVAATTPAAGNLVLGILIDRDQE